MTFKNLTRSLYYRLRHDDSAWKHTFAYMWRQFKATCCQHVHVWVESKVRSPTRDKEHAPFDYPDPDGPNSYHMVIGCTCDKEWS